MAKYTFELRELFEPIKFNPPIYTREQVEGFFKDYELSDYLTSEQIEVINSAGIWNKDKLARKIVDHYYMRESGLETIGLFKHYAKVVMQELMEESALVIVDINDAIMNGYVVASKKIDSIIENNARGKKDD